MYQLSNMQEQDMAAIAMARKPCGVKMMNRKLGKITERGGSQVLEDGMPKYLCHGTSVISAFNICVDGSFVPSTGGAAGGPGVYFLAMGDNLDENTIIRGWESTGGSGYQAGGMIIATVDGLVTSTDSSVADLPAGVIGTIDRDKRQYVAHVSTIEFVAAVFDVGGLDDVLGKAMEGASGYTPAVHRCFRTCKEFLESDTGDGTTPMVRLTNALVNTPSQQPSKPRLHSAAIADTHKPRRAPKLGATDSRHDQATNSTDSQATGSATITQCDSGMVWDNAMQQWVAPDHWAQWQQGCLPDMVANPLPDYLAALPQQQPRQAWPWIGSSSSQEEEDPWPTMYFNQFSASGSQQYVNDPMAGLGPCAPLQEPFKDYQVKPGFLSAAVALQRETERAQRESDRQATLPRCTVGLAKRSLSMPMMVPLQSSQVAILIVSLDI